MSDFTLPRSEFSSVMRIRSARNGSRAELSIMPNICFDSARDEVDDSDNRPAVLFCAEPGVSENRQILTRGELVARVATAGFRAEPSWRAMRRPRRRLSSKSVRDFDCLSGHGEPWSDLVQLSAGTFQPRCHRSPLPDRTESARCGYRLSVRRKELRSNEGALPKLRRPADATSPDPARTSLLRTGAGLRTRNFSLALVRFDWRSSLMRRFNSIRCRSIIRFGSSTLRGRPECPNRSFTDMAAFFLSI